MKKPIKFAIIGLAVLASIIGGIYYMMMPVPVRMTPVMAQVAELSFTEQGVVVAENTVLVFPVAQGEIDGLYVREGQQVQAGEALLSVDDTALWLQLEQVQSSIRNLEAQLANLDVEQERMRQDLQSTRASLQGELRALDAQAADNRRTTANQNEAIYEQARIQNVLIEQNQNDVDLARDNFTRVESLFNNGVATRSELDAVYSALSRAESQLEASQHQLSIIQAGGVRDSGEYFAGARASLTARIAGITQQLGQDFTTQTAAQINALIDIERVNAAQLEREIANAIITAPVSGILTALQAQTTNFVNAAVPVAEITVPGNMSVETYVSTQDISSIHVGDTVGLTLRQRLGDIEFDGRVTEIDSTAVVRFTALGVEERKVSVRIEPNLPAGVQLGIGYAVDATFYVFREEDQIIVPRTALFKDNGADMIWVVRGSDSGQVHAAPVVTGMELRTETIVESGLNVGDFVINDANNQNISEGVRVINER